MNCCSPITASATETNVTYLKILQASNNVQSVVSALPDVEKLWPQDPDIYLKTVNQAAHVLGGAQNNPDAKQALQSLFESMMQKPCPTNEWQTRSWTETKCNTILFCLNFDKIRNDKSRWLDIAKFTGEVRSRIIPNYTNKGMTISVIANTPAEKLQLQKEEEENGKNIAVDALQATLRQTDQTLVFFLQDCFTRFPSSNPTNADFIKQISEAAHLTAAEIKN